MLRNCLSKVGQYTCQTVLIAMIAAAAGHCAKQQQSHRHLARLMGASITGKVVFATGT